MRPSTCYETLYMLAVKGRMVTAQHVEGRMSSCDPLHAVLRPSTCYAMALYTLCYGPLHAVLRLCCTVTLYICTCCAVTLYMLCALRARQVYELMRPFTICCDPVYAVLRPSTCCAVTLYMLYCEPLYAMLWPFTCCATALYTLCCDPLYAVL
jgi:hypothetical protein